MKTITEYLQKGHIIMNDIPNFAYYDAFDKIQPDDWVLFTNTNDSKNIIITQVKNIKITSGSFMWEFFYHIKISNVNNSIITNYTNYFLMQNWCMKRWTDTYKNVVYTFLNTIDKDKVNKCNVDAIKNKLSIWEIKPIGSIDTNLNIHIKPEYTQYENNN